MGILDLTSLSSNFTGDLITPDHAEYAKSIARWALNAEKRAGLVAYPKSNEDVVAVVRWAVSNAIPIAVKGGGHSASGSSSVDNGVVIDLEKHLGTVSVDAANKKVIVGGGALWKTVDETAIKHGLATVGGTVNHTGVGGLILGGGYGYLSGEHGLAIDNLLEATVITASGEILTVNETSHADLFWGIRGAGGNFGVVTQFVLRLYPQRATVYGGVLVFPPPVLEKAGEILSDMWKKGMDPKSCLIFGAANAPPAMDQAMLVGIVFYNGSEEEGKAYWKPLLDLGPVMNTAQEIPYELLNTLQNPNVAHGQNIYMSGTSFLSSESTPVLSKLFSKVSQAVAKFPSTGPPIKVMTMAEYFPMDAINRISPESTAFPNRGHRSGVVVGVMWDENNEERTEWAKKLVRDVKSELVEEQNKIDMLGGQSKDPKMNYWYANFECESNAPPSKSRMVFKENYPRLQKIKRMYDPNCVFSRWYGIEPEPVSA